MQQLAGTIAGDDTVLEVSAFAPCCGFAEANARAVVMSRQSRAKVSLRTRTTRHRRVGHRLWLARSSLEPGKERVSRNVATPLKPSEQQEAPMSDRLHAALSCLGLYFLRDRYSPFRPTPRPRRFPSAALQQPPDSPLQLPHGLQSVQPPRSLKSVMHPNPL